MKASYEQLCNIIIKNPSIETIEELKSKASSEGFTEATEYDLDLAIGWSMQASSKNARLNEIGIEKDNIIFIVEASAGYDESPKLIGVWKSLPDAIDNCKEDGKWILDYYVVSEQKINSNDKGKTVFTKSFNWESGKWDENFLKQN